MHKAPAQREIAACESWLKREFETVGARVVVALGAIGLKAVLKDPTRGCRMRSAKPSSAASI
jgi:DNA polymerase